jgi:predicted phosphoadenosine phosphosulfate sulfurtransferase
MATVSRYYKTTNVFEEALERIRWVFDEFKNVVVNYSGGKDSTIILEMALMVAKEKGRLPLPVFFIDQEIEWNTTIDMVRDVMYRPEVKPYWLQVPFKIENATSFEDGWLYAWRPGDEWIRPKDPIAIHEKTFPGEEFHDLFEGWGNAMYGGTDLARLTGVRGEESRNRLMGLTCYACYKWVTWGRKHSGRENHISFSPIYDWYYTDVWKAIHEHGWKYNALYDIQYQRGVPVRNMRVSNLHHETAVKSLEMLQEIDHDLYNKVTRRLNGIDAYTKISEIFIVKKLPFMFASWREYRDFLFEKIVTDESAAQTFQKHWKPLEDVIDFIGDPHFTEALIKSEINAMLVNDRAGTKLNNLSGWIDGEKKKAEARKGVKYVDRKSPRT